MREQRQGKYKTSGKAKRRGSGREARLNCPTFESCVEAAHGIAPILQVSTQGREAATTLTDSATVVEHPMARASARFRAGSSVFWPRLGTLVVGIELRDGVGVYEGWKGLVSFL